MAVGYHLFMPPRSQPTDRTTSTEVGKNVARIRGGLGMTIRVLAEKLTELSVPLSSSGITDIEAGRRTISVDQLTALATALSVSPVALLMPYVLTAADEVVRLTGTDETVGSGLLGWLQGEAPIHVEDWADSFEVEHFRRRSLPPWAWKREDG